MDDVTLSFFIIVDPCPISKYEATIPEEEINYSLGDPKYLTNSYEFVQTPNCRYNSTVLASSETGMPSFVTFNT